jgi:hypothetical protein
MISFFVKEYFPQTYYKWMGWWYSNFRQIKYFRQMCKKADKNIFYPWDGSTIDNFVFEWMKQFIENSDRKYWPVDEAVTYQLDHPGSKNDMVQYQKYYDEKFKKYSIIERCYKFVKEVKEYNQKIYCDHYLKYDDKKNFFEITEGENKGFFEMRKTIEVEYHDFDYDFENDKLVIYIHEDRIIDSKIWHKMHWEMEEVVNKKEDEILKLIIDVRKSLWD